jgi:hypothetical protein
MENTQPVQPMEESTGESIDNSGEVEEGEEMKPMPFGILGISFLSSLTQYAVYLGLTMLILMLIRIFGPE